MGASESKTVPLAIASRNDSLYTVLHLLLYKSGGCTGYFDGGCYRTDCPMDDSDAFNRHDIKEKSPSEQPVYPGGVCPVLRDERLYADEPKRQHGADGISVLYHHVLYPGEYQGMGESAGGHVLRWFYRLCGDYGILLYGGSVCKSPQGLFHDYR